MTEKIRYTMDTVFGLEKGVKVKSMAGKDLRKRKGRKGRVGGEEMEKRKRWSRY